MSSRSAYAFGLAVAAVTLTACGSSTASGGSATDTTDGNPLPSGGPASSGSLPPLQTTPFPSPSADAHNPSIAQCRKDVIDVTNATEAYYAKNGIYAPDMKTLAGAGMLRSVPTDVRYGYDAPDVDPVVVGTVPGC